ncbi:DUF3750 domain-containing protein [Prosthecomicrobium sp. N25]|uniref:DUF3750 domain-containing protein n=1 Tax=Prosthecomicrobium sp. N25 TaxID=3129254 RepID=UPI003076F35A
MLFLVKKLLLGFVLLFLLPLAAHALWTWHRGWAGDWRAADWSSTGTLPPATADAPAAVRIFAARTGRWRGIFAVHTWIVLKDAGGRWERYDKVGWGTPIRRNGYAPDGRWFGHDPEVVFAADGAGAEALIPRMRAAVAAYEYGKAGDYRVWPGPNSNTFVASVMAAVPEIRTALPPTAIGKDFPHDGRWIGPSPSNTGLRLTLAGYLGLTVGWVEGLELNVLGAVAGLDVRRPAIKLPGFGRVGM